MKLKNVMIDIETLDTKQSAKILAIGAVEFDLKSDELGRKFYTTIDWEEQNFRTSSRDTIAWWDKQSKEARVALDGLDSLYDVLKEFRKWLCDGCIVWGNGATFDISILEHAYLQHKYVIPWEFWNIRDCRTIKAVYEARRGGLNTSFNGTKHNALDDAIYQAKCVSKMWHTLIEG